MTRYIFSVTSGTPVLLNDDQQRTLLSRYGSQDPALKYLRIVHYTLDLDDMAELHLIEKHRYKDPRSAFAAKFMSHAVATAAGFAELFTRPRFKVLYVVITVGEDYYELSALQDTHPVSINGSREGPVPLLTQEKVAVGVKSALAEVVGPLKQSLAQAKAQAAAALPTTGGMDI
jgi:hypothetical protein